MKIEAELAIYEVDGKEPSPNDDRLVIGISSHWNRNGHDGLVVLSIPGSPTISVVGRDLIKAIARATGNGEFITPKEKP